ncbi:MAG: alpha/beta hydrolase family protein [Gemmatimonadales bacterium]
MATPSLTTHSLPGAIGPIGVEVRAARRGRRGPAVVIVPGFKSFPTWGFYPSTADRFARAGCTAVTVNLSGSGADERGEFTRLDRFARNTFGAEIQDLATVLEGLGRGDLGVDAPSGVGLLGHSRGGVAVLANAGRPEVRSLVTWSAISSVVRWDESSRAEWRRRGVLDVPNVRTGQTMTVGLTLLDEVERDAAGALDLDRLARAVRVPWLIIHGTGDESVPFAEGRALAAANGAPDTRFVEVDGAGHTFGVAHPWAGSTPAFERVLSETVGWFARHLA